MPLSTHTRRFYILPTVKHPFVSSIWKARSSFASTAAASGLRLRVHNNIRYILLLYILLSIYSERKPENYAILMITWIIDI
jgi:hypothetical protein